MREPNPHRPRGLERIGGHAFAGRGGGRLGHIPVRLIYGLGLGLGQDHDPLSHAQLVNAHTGLFGGMLQRGRFVDMRNADGRAHAGRVQHIAARDGLRGKDQRNRHTAHCTATAVRMVAGYRRRSADAPPDSGSAQDIRSAAFHGHAGGIDGQMQHAPVAGGQILGRNGVDGLARVAVVQHQHARARAGDGGRVAV